MKLIRVKWGSLLSVYPVQQLLYFKWLPSASVTHLRFVQDPQIYTFEGKDVYSKLGAWLIDENCADKIFNIEV